MDSLEVRVSALELQLDGLNESLGWALVAIAELVAFRDTGAKHKQCKVCQQILPVTMTGQFMSHINPRGSREDRCINSYGHADG